MQLRCGCVFSNHLITDFPQNDCAGEKKSQIGHRQWDKSLRFTFLGHPVLLILLL